MAGEARCCCRLPQTVAVILFVFSLALSVSCFSLRGLGENVLQDKVVSEAGVMKERAENIFINEKELVSEPGSASAEDSRNNVSPHVDLDQAEGSELFAQESQLNDVMVNKAAWELLNPTLHCGQTKMKFKAMGPGAADLQLDLGNGYSLPLNQVNESCGYSMQQNALGLVLVVPYDGCNVLQENGNYVVLMRWLNTPVKFTCPILQSIEETPGSVTSNPAIHPQKLASLQKPWSLNRQKRHNPHSAPDSQYYIYWYYNYLNWLQTYYPYYYYYYYYNPSYYPLPATVPPATTSTTGPNMTTTQAPPTYYTVYYPNTVPNNSDIFYYAVIQHFYGKDPSIPMEPTAMPLTSTADTATQSQSSPMTTTTIATATTAPTQQTTKRCSDTTPTSSAGTTTSTSTSSSTSSSDYPGPQNPFVPYTAQTFRPYVLFDAFKKTGTLPDYEKYMPSAGYKSGLQPRAYPNLYWQSLPWQNHPPIAWENLQPKQD